MRTQFGLAWVIALAGHVLAGLVLCLAAGRAAVRPTDVPPAEVSMMFLSADPPPTALTEVLPPPIERPVIIEVSESTGPAAPTGIGAIGAAPAVAAPPSVAPAKIPVGLVVFVLDRSGSMGTSGKFGFARQRLLTRMHALPAGTLTAVVAFHRQAEVILPPTPVSADAIASVATLLQTLAPEGSTNPTAVGRLVHGWHPAQVNWLSDAPPPELVGCGALQWITPE